MNSLIVSKYRFHFNSYNILLFMKKLQMRNNLINFKIKNKIFYFKIIKKMKYFNKNNI